MKNSNVSNAINEFVSTKKYLLILLLVFVLLIVGGVVFWDVYSERRDNEAVELFESTDEQYNEFIDAYSMYKMKQDIPSEKITSLITKLTEVKETYQKSLAAQMATIRIGMVQLITQNYEDALQSFTTVVEQNTKSYFVPTVWFHIGSIQETLGNQDEAYKAFQRIVDNYNDSLVAPHAYYNLGRLAEENGVGDIQNAVGYYQSLIDNETWKKSPWANLAKSRLAMFGIHFDEKKQDEQNVSDSSE